MRVLVSAIGTMNACATAVVRAKGFGRAAQAALPGGDEVDLASCWPRSTAQLCCLAGAGAGSLARDQAQLKNAQLTICSSAGNRRPRTRLPASRSIPRLRWCASCRVRWRPIRGQVDAAKLQR